MQVPETPRSVTQLDLMRRLADYGQGKASWTPHVEVGPEAQKACAALHNNITQIVDKVLAPLLDRINAREMDTFTMHDRTHGLKVAHLMWHILTEERRQRLTPPEIALLVFAAHLHDIGMALSEKERNDRLATASDLWERLEVEEGIKERLEKLRKQAATTEQATARPAVQELGQMEEALLSQDTRARHATRERYQEVLASLRELSRRDPLNIPDIDKCLSFDGNSFLNNLIDVCISHNEDAEALIRRDSENPARPRFPSTFPIGTCTADLHLVAAALRLADILDFDRERTPPVLFYYLLPTDLTVHDSRSVLEWGKHMSISHWHIDEDAIVFRGRCRDHIIHHAIVLFCGAIQDEIGATRATFGALKEVIAWPFALPGVVKAEIHEEGYHYVPYRFELDDQRIYTLLMGGAIYDNPLVAVRELVQNAVDACKLRDALTQLYEPYSPITTNRIVVTYEEPTEPEKLPLLRVLDTGTGMDAFVLERYFLKVGQSYYNSPEFKRQRIELRKSALDFAPISEFGIGFLSCFLLADRVQVETAMWESPRGDTRKRTLLIDGPTRLIRLKDEPNEGSKRFKGTRVTLYLRHQSSSRNSLNWPRICDYLRDVCRELPYRLHLHYHSSDSANETYIDPNPMSVEVPDYLEPAILRIPVADEALGFEGEIALTDFPKARSLEREIFQKAPFELSSDADARSRRYTMYWYHSGSELRRGGFKIGGVPGLPRPYLETIMSRAKIRLTWRSTADSRYIKPNLARNHTADDRLLGRAISRTWITYLLEHRNELSASQLHNVDTDYRGLDEAYWLERFSAYEVYQLGRIQWCYDFRDSKGKEAVEQWEQGALQSIWLGKGHDLRADLLELVLPRICNLILSEDGEHYVSQPAEDWVRQLEQCRDFVTNRVRWGPFATYTEKIKGLLFYGYPGYKSFNIRFKDRLASFKEEDLETLQEALYQMIRAREERQLPRLGTSEASIVLAAIEAAGELTVGAHRGLTWTLKSFAPPKT